MLLLLAAFFAGMITVLAPCVLPLLPIIIGGSVSGNVHDKRRPFIIAASLAISLMAFTVLLKATTLLIKVDPAAITFVSGGIIVAIGIVFLLPELYEKFILAFNLQAKSQQLLGKSGGKGAIIGAIITGAALGPVFSSCSPVYGYILATVLPVDFNLAMIYMTAYVLGLSGMLLLIGFLGQKFVRKLKFASNPKGWFQRIVAILFILVGILVMTGYDKKLQTYVSDHTPFDFDGLSSQLIPSKSAEVNGDTLNVKVPYVAPEFVGLQSWINSDPLTMKSLKGKVGLVDFWTYSCINCIRTQPYLKEWYKTYKDSGFEIIGVHAPEFSFERVPENVKKAVKEAGLTYPIALDNDLATWNAYNNLYWPASYLIDKDGNVRRTHFGEGEYKETEEGIRALIAEKGGKVPEKMAVGGDVVVPITRSQTPETYLGVSRASNFEGTPRLKAGTSTFSPSDISRVNDWTLGGSWQVDNESITARGDSILRFRVAAKNVYFVTGSEADSTKMTVTLNGKQISDTGFAGEDVQDSMITIKDARLYKVIKFDSFTSDATLELHVPDGVKLNAFTFGS
jgi:cytochrome c biogenesis protein CcdA/thiol-disulfide isomerase/thioredoxin